MREHKNLLASAVLALFLAFGGILLAPQAGAAQGNANVKKAQQELQDKGYYKGNIDGLMGPQTHSAIRQYQQAENLPQTGNLDSKTASGLGVSPVTTRRRAKSGPVEKSNMKAAYKSVGKGGKEFGHAMKNGKPVKAGGELGKSIGHAGKEVGKAAKKAVKP